jgi:signal transduction histidine kinase
MKRGSSSAARWPWAVAIVLVIAILVAGGYVYYRTEVGRIQREKYDEIAAIADLKARQIEQWRKERFDDALENAQGPFLKKTVLAWLRNPHAADLPELLRERLLLEQKLSRYSDVLLFDTSGRLLLSARTRPTPVTATTKQTLAAALASRTAVLSSFYRSSDGIIHLDAAAPILDTTDQPAAVMLLRSDAKTSLYPLIQSWPTPSRTAETLLVRRDGENVLFLNELRHQANTALILREPLTRVTVPAVQAVLGKVGMFQGRDYRNAEVLADLRPIPGSPWFMVTKVDTHEILAEARYRAVVIALVVFLTILLVASAIVYTYRGRQIAGRRKAEEEVRNLNIELEQRVRDRTVQLEAANKEMEAFSYSVSHDLRAPLRAIDGFSRVMLEDHAEKLNNDGKRYLNIIRSNTKNMGQLIDDLLALSRLGRHEIRVADIDMEELARTVSKEMKLAAPRRKIKFKIQKLPRACADHALIRQVFANLLSNAVKFTRSKEVASIEINCSNGEHENVYCVKDNGAGFDMKYVDKLFGVFQRLHSSDEFEGTGVGLAIVQRIIHRHGGRVWAEGKVNKGASFYFTLPQERKQ